MKALFNAKCDECGTLKPRCARVFMRRPEHGPNAFDLIARPLCPDCRKKLAGKFQVAAQHK